MTREEELLAYMADKRKARWKDLENEFVKRRKWPKGTFVKYFTILKKTRRVLKSYDSQQDIFYYILAPEALNAAISLKISHEVKDGRNMSLVTMDDNMRNEVIEWVMNQLKAKSPAAERAVKTWYDALLKGLTVLVNSKIKMPTGLIYAYIFGLIFDIYDENIFEKFLKGEDLDTTIAFHIDGKVFAEAYKSLAEAK